MKKFVFEYHNQADPSEGMDDSVMKKWNDWFSGMGEKLVDAGNPYAPGGMAVEKSGASKIENWPSTGYSIVSVDDMDAAVELAKGCPVLDMKSGAVRVYEALPM